MASKGLLTIYGHQASRASRPYWLLRELGKKKGVDWDEVDTGGPVTGYTAVRDSAEFLAMNPNRLIPVMIDPGAPDSEGKSLVLYESMAICQHIAAKFGGPL